MNSVPSGWKLLDILYLLAYPLDLSFQFYNEGAEGRRSRLRSHGVDFAKHLLRQEVELLARGLAGGDRLLRLLDVMRESRQLFGDIALLRHQHDFLRDPVLTNVNVHCCSDFLHTLPEVRDHLLSELVAMLGQTLLQITEARQSRGDVGLQRLPFPLPHGHHLLERLAD